jgi:uncharacterized protein with PIN domain
MLINLIKKIIIFLSVSLLIVSCSILKKDATKNKHNIVKNKKETKDSMNFSVQSGGALITNNTSLYNKQSNYEIKKLTAEVNYLKEQIANLDVKSSLYADPFSVYNKEILLNNGSSIFCKILSQDSDKIFVETLIGNLTLQKASVVRIVENIVVLEENKRNEEIVEISDSEKEQIIGRAEILKQRKSQSSASVILMGEINESSDKSGNTILIGELKNVGTERADLVRIDFILRKNFQGDIERLTAYATGSSHIFKDSGIISNSSVLPGAIGHFKLIIPNSIGNFIGYSYELYWDQYE